MSGKIILTELQKAKIEKHTLECYPNEMCGILTIDDFIPLENIHSNPLNSFKIKNKDFIKYLTVVTAIIHSHTRELNKPELLDLRTPSYKDMQQQKLTNLPWLIVSCESITVTEPLQFPRIPNNEYVGRRFQWFIYDCYTLIQDWYRFELNIILDDHTITEDYQDLRHLNDLFEPYIESYGFKEVPFRDLKDHDLILLDNSGFKSNHLGVYYKGNVIHQDMLSVSVPLETFIGRVNKVLRYES
jgi:proteasome lid subunit RPN8/RPN11